MNKKLPILIVALVLIVGAIVLLSGGFSASNEPSPFLPNTQQGDASSTAKPKLEIGKQAPDFELQDFEGNAVRLSDFRGKPVMIDFWAKWCPFCTDEMPEINSVFNEFAGDLIVLGIHRTSTESLEAGKNFATSLGINYILLQDNTDEVYKTYGRGQQFMPLAAYIDAEGVVVSTKAGPKTASEIKEKINEIAANATN